MGESKVTPKIVYARRAENGSTQACSADQRRAIAIESAPAEAGSQPALDLGGDTIDLRCTASAQGRRSRMARQCIRATHRGLEVGRRGRPDARYDHGRPGSQDAWPDGRRDRNRIVRSCANLLVRSSPGLNLTGRGNFAGRLPIPLGSGNKVASPGGSVAIPILVLCMRRPPLRLLYDADQSFRT